MSTVFTCNKCGDTFEVKKKYESHVQRHADQVARAENKAKVNEFLLQLAIKIVGEYEAKSDRNEGLSREEVAFRVSQDPAYKEESKKNPLVSKLGEYGRYLKVKKAKEYFLYDYEEGKLHLLKNLEPQVKKKGGRRGGGGGGRRGGGTGPGRGHKRPSTSSVDVKQIDVQPPSETSKLPSPPIVLSPESQEEEDFSGVDEKEIDEEEKRQRQKDKLYALTLAQIICTNHNGNKNGAIGFYADRQKQRSSVTLERAVEEEKDEVDEIKQKDELGPMFGYQLERGAYNGHNIAAIAVNLITGKIIGCEFNHCILLKSTTAHAEERLIDYLFKTAETCGLEPTVKYSEFLRHVAIYTSLEPCYQCAGKMIMAGVKRCIWLQNDPLIRVKVMKEISKNDPDFYIFSAAVNEVCPDFKYSERLEKAYLDWKEKSKFFFIGPDENSRSNTVPTWLCTDSALDIYKDASKEFRNVIEGWQKSKTHPVEERFQKPVFGRTVTSLQSSLFSKQDPDNLDELSEHLCKAAKHYLPENYNRGAHHT